MPSLPVFPKNKHASKNYSTRREAPKMMLLKFRSFTSIFLKIFNYIRYSVQKTCKKHEKTRWFVSPKNVFPVCLCIINMMRKTVKMSALDPSSEHVFEAIPRGERPPKWCSWKFKVLLKWTFFFTQSLPEAVQNHAQNHDFSENHHPHSYPIHLKY